MPKRHFFLGTKTITHTNTRYNNVFKRYRQILASLLTLVPIAGQAQYDVSFSHYFDMEPSFNAASVGKDAKLNVTAAYAMDFAGFEHNPRTMYVGADMPFRMGRTLHGAGIQFMNDKIGLFAHQRLALQYALRTRLFGGQLGIGLQAGLVSETFDGTKLDVDDSNDPALSTSKLDGNTIDLGVGLYYTRRSWYAGVSVQHANAPLVNLGERNELQIDRTYYATAGCTIRLRNPFVTIKPSMLARTDGTAWRADVGGRVVYTNERRMMYGGVSYSPTNSVTFLVGGRVRGIMLGYSYEMYTSGVNPGNGSHELHIGFQTDINLAKKGRNLHKSVRTL